MQTPVNPQLNWKTIFSDYLQCELVKPSRHKWVNISDEIVGLDEHCIYAQCEHCKKYMAMFTHAKIAAVYLNSTQVAHVNGTIKPYGRMSLCERLLIMT